MSKWSDRHAADAQRRMDMRECPPDLTACARCKQGPPVQSQVNRAFFRCVDCHSREGMCATCVFASHRDRPFDRILAWDDELGCWTKTTLLDMGLVWHLRHPDTNYPQVCECIRVVWPALRLLALWSAAVTLCAIVQVATGWRAPSRNSSIRASVQTFMAYSAG
ncbi:hypothetical protein NUW54_g14475 [Trametes sanguinea]|uniref:Uncharacterized protein n=1 Tax=Trametes sanguinea TaxID=158606 RepID=A0ACC1MCN6_9APHY|nr:hypothetical protein NUW54_g14475 [Trametes sanguinea]